ncbi:hypothetical protein [Alishewanella longhuensis]
MPLAVKAEFFTILPAAGNSTENKSAPTNAEAVADNLAACSAAEATTEIAANSRYQPIPATRLAEDINAILPLTTLSHWQIDSLASHSQICEQILITPPLALLQQTVLKRQLWQLLSEQFHD